MSMGVVDLDFFFFNDTATTEIYTLSLHDALPISTKPYRPPELPAGTINTTDPDTRLVKMLGQKAIQRSEEHTAELQSRQYLVCRLLLVKKNTHLHRLIIYVNDLTVSLIFDVEPWL